MTGVPSPGPNSWRALNSSSHIGLFRKSYIGGPSLHRNLAQELPLTEAKNEPIDSAPELSELKSAPSPMTSPDSALRRATVTALNTASTLSPGSWMIFPAKDEYRGRLDQEMTVDELKPYAKKRLGELPKDMPLGQVLAYTGASSLTDMTRHVGKYKEQLKELSQLGTDFQGGLVVSRDESQASLVVLAQEGTPEGAQVKTFQDVVRNEKARTGLLELLANEAWTDQLEGSKLSKLRPQLEKPETDVKQVLSGALGELEGGYTAAHTKRAVEQVGLPLATELGMSDEQKQTLNEISGLYDIGKLCVNEEILDYDGKWPEDKAGEWFGKVANHVHPEIVEPLLQAFDVSDSGKEAVLHHHERPNGWAYCKGSDTPAWQDIPAVAKVLGMADTVDAMQWKKANVNRPVEQKLDPQTMQKFLTGDAEKGKVDGELVHLVFDKVLTQD